MEIGDKVQLSSQEVEVVGCEKCDKLMVNLDAKELKTGDLLTLKNAGLRISNPETEDPICIKCEVETWGRRLSAWFDSDDDDDSTFFPSSGGLGGGLFGGGGFSTPSFGGFGGGSFSGGGASGSF